MTLGVAPLGLLHRFCCPQRDCVFGPSECYPRGMTSTRINRHLRAPRSVVYRVLLDPGAVAQWRVPFGMTSRVHWFDAREGGTFRVSLTYDAADRTGKTTAGTDTYQGRFVRL